MTHVWDNGLPEGHGLARRSEHRHVVVEVNVGKGACAPRLVQNLPLLPVKTRARSVQQDVREKFR